MKLVLPLVATVHYQDWYEFPEDVWLDFKDTVRDNSDFPDHDEDIRFEYDEDFYEWLGEQMNSGDTRITKHGSNQIINGDYQSLEWTD
jgi:hypothetical protein